MNKLFNTSGMQNPVVKEFVENLPPGATIFGNSAPLIAAKRDDLIKKNDLQVSVFRNPDSGDELTDILDDLGFEEQYVGKSSTVFSNTECSQYVKDGIKFVIYDQLDGDDFVEFAKGWDVQNYTDIGSAAIYRSEENNKMYIGTNGRLTPQDIVNRIESRQFSMARTDKIKTDSTKRFIAALKEIGFVETAPYKVATSPNPQYTAPPVNKVEAPIPPPMPKPQPATVNTPAQKAEFKPMWVTFAPIAAPAAVATGMMVKPSFMQMTKSDAIKAAYRIAGHQITVAVKTMIVNLMKNQGKDNATVEMIATMLDTEYGEAIVSTLVGMSLTYAPENISGNVHVQNIAKEFRVNGMATAGDALIGDIIDTLLPVIYQTLSTLPQIEALKTEEKIEAKVEEHEFEEEMTEEKTKHMTA
jgi:hypothetical protein